MVKFYFTGNPCKNGHISKRYVSSRICLECHLIKDSPKLTAIRVRKEAKDAGQLYYNTKKPCNKGHNSDRLTSNGSCLECSSISGKEKNGTGYRKEYQKEWQNANFERLIEERKIYYQKNKKEFSERTNKYRSIKKNALAKWANLEKIREIYKNKPEGYHVDHIIPLTGKLVCGLHVENNLQYLTATENLRKSNKFTPVNC